MNKFNIIITCLTFLISCSSKLDPNQPIVDKSTQPQLGYKGLHGYIGYGVSATPANYGVGVSFYTAAWKLIDQPVINFQIGLPGAWIVPDNRDNETIALCPPGTLGSTWSERGPTFRDVFQTLEGGLGYWAGNKYRYGPPKYSMNATAQCYDYEIASPGWSFFYDDVALPDERLGIAQLHNRILIPPDGMTFEGNPDGEFMGYSYMALPLTDAYQDGVLTGDQSWTCFINTANFKGPIAYYLPETWSKISKNYPIISGKGLDSKPGIANGGAMEINTVPHFEAKDSLGTVYTKIPKLNFPVDDEGNALLVQNLNFYNKDALYNDILEWRKSGKASEGFFKESGTFKPVLNTSLPVLKQRAKQIANVGNIFSPFVKEAAFGIKWNQDEFGDGEFPQYFKDENGVIIPIKETEVPEETGLKKATFPLEDVRPTYSSPDKGSWTNPGPASGPFTAVLNDRSTVTYYWYRFIDQPVFQQYNWTDEKKNELQGLVEEIHKHWTMDKDYIPPPSFGELLRMDESLIVTPPPGMEFGFVPIVTKQDR